MQIIREITEANPIKTPEDVYHYLDEFRTEDREHFIVIGLDTRNKPIYREIVSIGTLNSALVHPREVFKKAIVMSANSLIVAHNHPSGDTTPSNEDIEITKKIEECGDMLHINLLDSLIIGKDDYNSILLKNNEV